MAHKHAHDFVGQRNWQPRGMADLPTLTIFTNRTSSHGCEERFSSVTGNEGTGGQKCEQCPHEIDLMESVH
jgi:hypothetical protein